MTEMSAFRKEFPVTRSYTYLNHAAVSPMPRRVAAELGRLNEDRVHHGIAVYPEWVRRIGEVRGLLARLIGAEEQEVAFVGNTSEGLSAVAGGIDWRPGDAVLVSRPDFPSNIYPWLDLERKGVEVIFVERRGGVVEADDVRRAIRKGVRLLAVSSVDFLMGGASDLPTLGELCREAGILFCVDAVQSLGVLPIDVRSWGIHFLAAGGHKWLLGPMGCGMLYVGREAAHLLHPVQVGWKSVENEEDFFSIHYELKAGAAKFEPGTLNVAGIYALGAAVELLLEVGMDAVRRRILQLNDLLTAGLSERGLEIMTPMSPNVRSGILTFRPRGEALHLFKAMLKERVLLSERGGLIRISPHFYNDEGDAARFFEVLDRLL